MKSKETELGITAYFAAELHEVNRAIRHNASEINKAAQEQRQLKAIRTLLTKFINHQIKAS